MVVLIVKLMPLLMSSLPFFSRGSGSHVMDVDANFDIDAAIDASASSDPSIAGKVNRIWKLCTAVPHNYLHLHFKD